VLEEANLRGIEVGFMLEDGHYDFANLVALEIEEKGGSPSDSHVTPRKKRDLRMVSSSGDAVVYRD
jgi:hypothetical protein